MKRTRTLAVIFVVLSLATSLAYAQGVGASGEITGSVTAASNGGGLANAKISVVEINKGQEHIVTTGPAGQYHVTGLPPGPYQVSVELAGFDFEILRPVEVHVGEIVSLDFPLKVSQVKERVEVNAAPPIVNTSQGEQSDVISEQYIMDLPINRRDYLTYTLLAPGVSDSTVLASSQDFRVVQTPQSGLSFYGSNGRGNNVTIDGGEANDDAGGARLTLSQEGVQEFQVNRSNYGAALGGASGANINIVSKSGTNHYHGSLFGFFRNDALDAQDPFAFNSALPPGALSAATGFSTNAQAIPTKNSLSRQQFGGSFGGPLDLDKTFFFFSYEGLRDSEQKSVPLLTNSNIFAPTGGQAGILAALTAKGVTPVNCLPGQLIPAAICAGILQNVLTVNPVTSPLNKFLVSQFENNSGLFPFAGNSDLGSLRLDHEFNAENQIFLRFNAGRDDQQNPNVQGLTGFSRGNAIHQADYTLEGAYFHQFSSSFSNEFRLQGNASRFNAIPNNAGGPGFELEGFASFNRDHFLASLTKMRRFDIADNFTLISGRHTMSFGGSILVRKNETLSQTFMAGDFSFGPLPGGVLSPCLAAPTVPVAFGGCGLAGVAPAALSSLDSASLGLPLYYEQGFGNPVQTSVLPLYAFFWQDQWKAASNFTLTYGLRYELDERSILNTYPKDFAPRVSFAWDPFKDHKTVVRGGFGMFYSPVYFQIDDVVSSLGNNNGTRQISNFLVPLTGSPGNPALTSAAIFQTLFAQGKLSGCTLATGQASCIAPADLAQFGINATANSGPVPPLAVLFGGQPDYRNPYSEQAEIGIERELSPGFSVSASGIYVHTLHLPVALDSNLLNTAPFTNVALANGKTVAVQNWNSITSANPLGSAPCAGAVIFTCFANPLLLQNNIYSSKGSALYFGGILEIKKRFSDHFSLLANYTYSRATDTTTDFNSDFSPQNETSLAADRALSDFDERHKLVIAGIANSPWHNPFFSDFELNPIFNYNSGHPFNLLAGTDVNGDNHPTNDRPIGAGRNTGMGPDYLDLDLRLSRSFRVGEKSHIELMAEAFNLLNRTNFASVNNVIGPNALLPLSATTAFGGGGGLVTDKVGGRNTGNPSLPLSFASDYPKRQLQFGARFSF